MLNHDYILKVLNMEDVIVTKVENEQDYLRIYMEMPVQEHTCPKCGQGTTRIHDYREQVIKDIPLGRTTYIHLRKRRYVCPHCKKRFYETIPFLARYHRTTSRLVAAVINDFRQVQPAKAIAARYNLSSTTALRYFDLVEYRCSKLPRVLSIDEFKGNADGEKYQCILTDADKRSVLDILPNRFECSLIQYFRRFPDRSNVEFFVTDMNPHFRAVARACFPNATIIADRYHVTRQVLWAMENVRKKEQKRLSKRHRTYFKRSKSLLKKHIEKLTEEEKEKLAFMFELSPRLAQAYKLKNYFLLVMHSNTKDSAKLLRDWLILAENYGFEEFSSCITAFHNWFTEIVNALCFPWSNGYTEGCNNKTKVLKRVCYGVRKFDRFRNRILHCAA